MNKFTFKSENFGVENTMVFECETWDEAVENFHLFLRGCGFVFTEGATLEMVEPEQRLHSPFGFSDYS